MRRLSKKPPVASGCARQVEAVTPSDVSADRNRRTGSAVGLDKSLFANRNYLAITLEKRRYRRLLTDLTDGKDERSWRCSRPTTSLIRRWMCRTRRPTASGSPTAVLRASSAF